MLMTVVRFLEIYIWILFARILLSWFPAVDWYKQPFKLLRDMTDPILEPFRRLIPAIGGIDFSPIVLFIVIQLLQKLLIGVAVSIY